MYVNTNGEIIAMNKKVPVLGGFLTLTDDYNEALLMSECGEAVIYIDDSGDYKPGLTYVAEDEECCSREYIFTAYCRQKGVPFTIAERELTQCIVTDSLWRGGTRLILREISIRDLPDLFTLHESPYMTPFRSFDEEKAELTAYIKQAYGVRGWGIWGVYLRAGNAGQASGMNDGLQDDYYDILGNRIEAHDPANDLFLGVCGLSFIQEMKGADKILRTDDLMLGYGILPQYRGRGIAGAACKMAVSYALDILKAGRVYIISETGNLPSRRLAERLGKPVRKAVNIEDKPYCIYVCE